MVKQITFFTMMNHMNNDSSPKIVPRCTLLLTAMEAAKVISRSWYCLRLIDGLLTLTQRMPGAILAEFSAKTTASFVEKLHLAAKV